MVHEYEREDKERWIAAGIWLEFFNVEQLLLPLQSFMKT